MNAKTALIIGGGISGLAAAYRLSRSGYRVTVLERREVLGGLARSMTVNGKPLEVYYHFICGGDHWLLSLISELGLDDALHWAPARTAYFVDGRLYPLTSPFDLLRFRPLSLAERIRFGLLMLYCRRVSAWEHLEHLTAHDWLTARLGSHAYDVIWRSLLDLKFGRWGETVSAPWVWHRLHRVSKSRAQLFQPEQMGYLTGGTETLLQALATRIREAGGEIRTGVEATRLLMRGDRVVGGRTADDELTADIVVAATQIPDLVRLLPDSASDYRAELSQITFLGVVCVMLKAARNLTEFFWVNARDARVPCNGFIEYSNLNPWREWGGSAITYFPFYTDTADPLFGAPDKQITAPLIAALGRIRPDMPLSEVEDVIVTRDAVSQAVCPPQFSRHIPAISTPVQGLYLLDSTQLYPSDRCLSGMIGLANELARTIGGPS